jgi:hypothetical protein
MTEQNPYNASRPGNLFVGYERLRHNLLDGFGNGNSYAVLGGRRCGKTSLLLQLVQDLQPPALAPFTPLPRFLDIQGLDRPTPALLFETIYTLVVQGVTAPTWVPEASGRDYQHFLAFLDAAKPLLDQHYGPDWLVILLVDELDAALVSLPDDQFFQNLRNLLMVSRFQRHFRLVASGVTMMAHLIASGSSPLNNLRHLYLRVLTGSQARQLIAFGFPQGLDPDVEFLLFQMTGKHPYLLQGLLEHIWENQTTLDRQVVRRAAWEFLHQQSTFPRWLDAFGLEDHAVYQCLAETPEGTLHVRDIRHRLDAALSSKVDDALTVLSYHGVVDDSEPDEPRLAGTLFRDWYRENRPRLPHGELPQPKLLSLFCSYSHRDEALRHALETHLALLRRQGYIASWYDRRISAGEEWKHQIDAHLEAADIILLLVSADFLASDYCYDIEMRRALERHNTGEARVIPVIVRAVDWTGAPFDRLKILPRDAKPVSTWNDPDEAWADVAWEIRQAVGQLRRRL